MKQGPETALSLFKRKNNTQTIIIITLIVFIPLLAAVVGLVVYIMYCRAKTVKPLKEKVSYKKAGDNDEEDTIDLNLLASTATI